MSDQTPAAAQRQDFPVASRRSFLRTSAAVTGTSLAGLALARSVHAASDDTLKVGLIGCGGRGTGAAKQALLADENVKLTALGDVFGDHLESSLANLKKQKDVAHKIDVADDHKFVGFDAYQQVLASDVDVVILTTPPHFRPAHLAASVAAGKHVFCEKPIAVDATGVRSVIETCKAAKAKNLSVVSGLCWRYDNGVRETMKRVADGQIGDIVAIQENYLAGGLWKHARRPEWSDMEYQLRNWLYYAWLSGDHNVEQHIHSLDKTVWAMGDTPPISAVGLGGRQARVEPIYGHIFDHHAVVYEWAGGMKMFAFCRQQDGCTSDVDDYILGTKGRATVLKNRIEGETTWKYRGDKNNMYQTEHDELFAAIRSGTPINNGHYMSVSTMVAIMGRMATYSGKKITWDQAINSTEDLTPAAYNWGPLETPLVAIPGQTQLVV